MRTRFFLLLLLSLPLFLSAQKKVEVVPPVFPVDSITRLITYEGVSEVKDASAEVLYHRTLQWFRSYYKNPSEVIRENDSLKLRIVGKPRFRISNPPDKTGLKTDAGIVQYTITVAAKAGRFRYELTEFNWKQTSYYPCERWSDRSSATWNPAYFDYLGQLDATAKKVIEELQKALSVPQPVKNRDDW